MCYFNANWISPTHAGPEEEQLQLHTGFCTGWASWKTGFNIQHFLTLYLQLCNCSVQGWKGLELSVVTEGGHTDTDLFNCEKATKDGEFHL